MKNNSFFKKYKTVIIIFSLLFCWSAFIFWVIIPAQNKLRENFIAVEKRKLDNSVNEDKIKKMPSLKEDFDLVEGSSENLDVIFTKDKIVDLVNEMESLADKTGNKINISVGDEKKIVNVSKGSSGGKKEEDIWGEFMNDLPSKNYFMMDVSLVGDYAGLINFIEKLNNIKYYNVVKSLSVVKKVEKIEGNTGSASNQGDQLSVLVPIGEMDNVDISSESKFLETNLVVLFYTLEENKNENK